MEGNVDGVTAAILGAVQGATEFLPVSSSGHVSISALILGVSDDLPLSMVVLLHLGTLIATVALFRRDLVTLTRSTVGGLGGPRAWAKTEEGKMVLGILIASVPTAAIGLGLEPHVEEISKVPWALGLGLLASAAMVLSTLRGGGQERVLSLWKAFVVGVAQGIAVLPGVSRSGTTIAVAMMLGMTGSAAFRFSFLLSLPAVAGATLLSARHYAELQALGVAAPIGGVAALVSGVLALIWLRRLVDRGHFHLFAVYLIPVGLGLLVYEPLRRLL